MEKTSPVSVVAPVRGKDTKKDNGQGELKNLLMRGEGTKI